MASRRDGFRISIPYTGILNVFEMYFSYAVAVLWMSGGRVASQLYISCTF